jgi:hypothetical protein
MISTGDLCSRMEENWLKKYTVGKRGDKSIG